MSGAEMTVALRSKYGSDIVVIAVTGSDPDSPQAHEALEQGVDFVMMKPVDVGKLFRILGVRR